MSVLDYSTAAPAYLKAGWEGVLPLDAKQKFPPPKGFTGAAGRWPTADELAAWADEHGNLALRLPEGVIGLDVDHYGTKRGGDELHALEGAWGELPSTWMSTARAAPSGIRLFRAPLGVRFNGEAGPAIDIVQHRHRYVCAWPSYNAKAGAIVQWIRPDGSMSDGPPRPDELAKLPDAWVARLRADQPKVSGSVDAASNRGDPAVHRALGDALAGLHGGSRHDATLHGVMALERYVDQGLAGAVDALEALHGSFVNAVTSDGSRLAGEPEAEWGRMVEGALHKIAATPSTLHSAGHPSPGRNVSHAGPAAEAAGASIFDHKGRVITARLGELIQAVGKVRTGLDGQLYRYDEGLYRPDGEGWTRARVREHLGDKVRRYHASEVLAWLHSFEPTVHGAPLPETINVANGLLDWKTGELRPHTPDVVSTVQLPVPWIPSATCPRTSAFLAEVFPADAVETAWEIMGYAAYAGNPHRKAVLLLGPGGNGKSTYLAVVRAMLGAANVATAPARCCRGGRAGAYAPEDGPQLGWGAC